MCALPNVTAAETIESARVVWVGAIFKPPNEATNECASGWTDFELEQLRTDEVRSYKMSLPSPASFHPSFLPLTLPFADRTEDEDHIHPRSPRRARS